MSHISIEAITDSGAPRAGIKVTGLSLASPSTVTVSRSVPDEASTVVRGVKSVSATGSGYWLDFEVPLNVEVTYTLMVAGPVSLTESTTITVLSEDLWLQDPLLPRTAVRISAEPGVRELSLMGASFASLSYTQPADTVVPLGASIPVSSIGQRVTAGKIPLSISHTLADEGTRLLKLLMSSGILLLRGAPPELHLPTNAFIRVGDVKHEPMNPSAPGTISTWSMTADIDRGPSISILVPWWSYDDVRALWPGSTYAATISTRPGDAYIDWLRTPERP